jgi:hypothetical protein
MFFAPVVSKKFEIKASIDAQMAYFSNLRSTNPEKAKDLYDKGEQLVQLASNGEFRKIRVIVDSCEEVCRI